jgi:hypothetical protein
MRILMRGASANLAGVLELLTPRSGAPRGRGPVPTTLAEIRNAVLADLLAILIVLTALSVPVLVILWRLHRPYS